MTTPLTLLTGFLGAGKTTLLNRILHADHGLQVAVLVNDFGAVNIDSAMVEATQVDADTVSLSNGCICCTIRGDLIGAVETVVTAVNPPEYIVLEASGVSDPLEVAMTFRDVPRMQELVHIDSIISLIDAEQFSSYEREYAVLAMNQIGVADLVVLNKVDLVEAEALAELEQTITRMMPTARIFKTSYAEVPLPLLLGVGTYDPARLMTRVAMDVHVHSDTDDHDHHHHPDHSTVFHTWNWRSLKPLSLRELKRTVTALPTSIYRLKGVVNLADMPETRATLHVVGTRVTLETGEAWDIETPYTQLVAIGAAGDVDSKALTQQFEAALAENAPKHELERFTRRVQSWLRGGD